MLLKYFNKLKLSIQIPELDSDREEFYIGINETNVARAKITTISFIAMEVVILILTLILKSGNKLNKQDVYYIAMYILMILSMTAFLTMFIKMGKNITKYNAAINAAGLCYGGFMLIWCAGISLMDQSSGGEIIVYVIAIIAVAVTPIYRPIMLLTVYLVVQTLFLILLPQFNPSGEHLFGNCVNSTTIIIISWAISCMRYRNRADDFLNRKELQKKSEELKRVNMELEEANHKLKILSQTDSLTGVFNRLVFDKILKKEWNLCKNRNVNLSLIMIDVDFFKLFNDNYGHQAGDDCLRQVAEVISDCAEHSSATVVRYGGEEFAIILPDMEKEDAYKLAEKMRVSVEDMNVLHEYSSISDFVTISLGVYTVIPTENLSIDDLIRTADKALYKAKNENRNKVIVA